jgi:hypothetical protein
MTSHQYLWSLKLYKPDLSPKLHESDLHLWMGISNTAHPSYALLIFSSQCHLMLLHYSSNWFMETPFPFTLPSISGNGDWTWGFVHASLWAILQALSSHIFCTLHLSKILESLDVPPSYPLHIKFISKSCHIDTFIFPLQSPGPMHNHPSPWLL